MRKLLRNETGFGNVEVVLLLVIIGMVGFVGWYVYQSKNKTNNIYNNAAQTIGTPGKASTAKASTAANTNSASSTKCASSVVSTPTEVNFAEVTYCSYVQTVLAAQSSSQPTELTGLASIQSRLTPALYSQLVASYHMTQPPDQMNDNIACAYGQMGYFDFPIKASLKSNDGKIAVVSIVEPIDNYTNGKDNYDYNQPPALYSVDLATTKVSGIDCSLVKNQH